MRCCLILLVLLGGCAAPLKQMPLNCPEEHFFRLDDTGKSFKLKRGQELRYAAVLTGNQWSCHESGKCLQLCENYPVKVEGNIILFCFRVCETGQTTLVIQADSKFSVDLFLLPES